MIDSGEAAALVFVIFIGIVMVGASMVITSGGDASGITNLASQLAGPVAALAILVFFGVGIYNALQGGGR